MSAEERAGSQTDLALMGLGEAKTRGRPVEHTEEIHKQNLILTATTKDFVDDMLAALKANRRRARGKKKNAEKFSLDISKFIRGCLLGIKLGHAGIDTGYIMTEMQLANYIAGLIERGRKAG